MAVNTSELGAIYRLEFYKKKDNWKLSHQPKDQPKKVVPKPIDFNKTYNIVIEPRPDVQDVSVLNQAFVETGSVNNTADHLAAESEKFYLEDQSYLTEEPGACYQEVYQEPEKLAPDMWHMEQQDWVPCPQYAVGADVGASPGWPVAAHHWTHAAPLLDLVDGPGGAFQCGPEPVSSEEWLGAGWAPPIHWSDHIQVQDQSTLSDDSVAEFMRGAHSAPHSSETDLQSSLSDSCEGVCEVAAEVSQLASLRDLLAEARLREYAASEALPGRLPDYNPHEFIAGSFQQRGLLGVEAGRGRGRRESIIRIGMGRPYRL